MEPTIALGRLQDWDDASHVVNSACLNTPVILRQIFQCISTKELIQLSLVNKLWNHEARSVMRNRGNLTASINKNHTCQDLRAFVSDLRRMKQMKKVIPFSGMTISVGGWKCANKDYCQQSPNRELETVYEEILGGMTWKHLTIIHLVGWEEHKSCPGFILQKKLLRKLDSVLEELSVQLEDDEAKSFREDFLRDCYFSRLKTFTLLNEEEPIEPEWSDFIKIVVSTAPNLQVLHTAEVVDLQANLLEGSSAVHVAGASYSTIYDTIPENVIDKLRMEGIHLVRFNQYSPFSLDSFNRITSNVLLSSCTVMTSMDINIIFLAPLMNYGIYLENLRELELSMDILRIQETQPPFWRIAKSFDFTRYFPNLKEVSVSDVDHRNFGHVPIAFIEMIDQVNATLQPPPEDRAISIKHLKLSHVPIWLLHRRSSFQLLAQLFPHVQKLSIGTSGNPLADIRDVWVDLKEVDLAIHFSAVKVTNLDVIFCGIFHEEVAQLREQDEEYLRRVNIVPVMPSIVHLKELRSIKIHFGKGSNAYTGPTDDPTCLFSKVTPLVAFQRYFNRTVTLTSEDERLAEALGHLRPYVSVVFKKVMTLMSDHGGYKSVREVDA